MTEVIYLSVQDLVRVNQHLCRQTGQPFGLLAPAALSESVRRPALCIEGYEPFAELWEKAAVLMDSLIKERPFLRANLLTGFFAADQMLRRNGQRLSSQGDDAELIISVSLQQLTVLQIAEWLRSRAHEGKEQLKDPGHDSGKDESLNASYVNDVNEFHVQDMHNQVSR